MYFGVNYTFSASFVSNSNTTNINILRWFHIWVCKLVKNCAEKENCIIGPLLWELNAIQLMLCCALLCYTMICCLPTTLITHVPFLCDLSSMVSSDNLHRNADSSRFSHFFFSLKILIAYIWSKIVSIKTGAWLCFA